jgi:hypothetical protein
VDLSGWMVLRLRGADTRGFLQGTATQDFAAPASTAAPAEAGVARKTLFLTDKGRPVALAWVSIAPDGASAVLIADEGARTGLRAHLERLRIMEDVEFEGAEDMPRVLGVAGPESDPLARAVAASIPGALAVAAEPLSFALVPRNAPASAIPPFVDPAAFQAWRICVGLPLMGLDLSGDRIATELSLPEVISLSKGCYVGQEVVARTLHRGHVRRHRAGFRFRWTGESIPAGTELRVAGVAAGHVTSSAAEPGTGDGLAMGYLTTPTLPHDLDAIAVEGEKTSHLRPLPWPL